MAEHQGEAMSTARIAEALGVSENHLSKVLQRLARAGLVRSNRGPSGGYLLEKDASDLTLLDIYEAIDGPVPEHGCLLDPGQCIGKSCIMGGMLTKLNAQIKDYLAGSKLSDLRGVYCQGG